MKYWGEFANNKTQIYNLISLTNNRICFSHSQNIIQISESQPPFKLIFTLNFANISKIIPKFQLSDDEILITYFFRRNNSQNSKEKNKGLISWDLNNRKFLKQFWCEDSSPKNISEIPNKKIIMLLNDEDSLEIINAKTLQIETLITLKLTFPEYYFFDGDVYSNFFVAVDGSFIILNNIGNLCHIVNESYNIFYYEKKFKDWNSPTLLISSKRFIIVDINDKIQILKY